MSRRFDPGELDSYAYNPYYHPEKCGITTIGVLDAADLSYEYDTIIVVLDNETKVLYAAHDSGCSCPTPFEDFKGLDDFTPIRTMDDFERFVQENATTYHPWPVADVFALRRKVKDELRGNAE